jgi:hypothetical protein
MTETQAKRCSRCAEIKPLGEFYKTANGAVQSRCKECMNWCAKWRRENKALGKSPAVHGAVLCPMCRETKPVFEFYTNESRKIDAGSQCRSCRKKRRDKTALLPGMQEKTCTKCGTTKSLTEFCVRKQQAGGFRSQCKICLARKDRQYYQTHKQISNDGNRAWLRLWSKTPKGRATKILKRVYGRAKQRGIPCNLSLEDIQLPVLCPVFGTVLDYEFKDGKLAPNSASLDRRIPELGYVKGNVEIISWRANRIKTNASPEELLKVALYFGMMS